jgi:hypothetical protein
MWPGPWRARVFVFSYSHIMHIMESQWFKKLLSHQPTEAFQLASQLEGLSPDLFSNADEVFSSVKQIEFLRIGTKKEPGWMIILDQKLSLWFYQKDGGWIYDGFEIGDYSSQP